MPNRPKQHRPAVASCTRPAYVRPTPTQRAYDRRWAKRSRWHRGRQIFCADPFGVHGGRLVIGRHVDHIVPLSQGGTNETSNLQTLCHSCHSRKTVLYDGGFGRERRSANDVAQTALTGTGGSIVAKPREDTTRPPSRVSSRVSA